VEYQSSKGLEATRNLPDISTTLVCINWFSWILKS